MKVQFRSTLCTSFQEAIASIGSVSQRHVKASLNVYLLVYYSDPVLTARNSVCMRTKTSVNDVSL